MNPIAKLAVFAVALLAVFAAGLGLGAAFNPADGSPRPEHVEHTP